jgi:hypothetical protein
VRSADAVSPGLLVLWGWLARCVHKLSQAVATGETAGLEQQLVSTSRRCTCNPDHVASLVDKVITLHRGREITSSQWHVSCEATTCDLKLTHTAIAPASCVTWHREAVCSVMRATSFP